MVRFLLAMLIACLAAGAAAAGEAPLISHLVTLDGGWRTNAEERLPLGIPLQGPRVRFVRPVGVAAFGDIVLVADAGARVLWRIERQRDSIARFAPYNEMPSELGASVQIGADFSAWVALPSEHRVVQYDARGRLVREWRDEIDVPRPVAVAVPPGRGEVLVADGALARIVAFNPLGRIERRLGRTSDNLLQSIAALAFGPQGLYVLDRVGQQVVLLDAGGAPLALIGERQLVYPRALAADRHGRIFVSDDSQQKIMVFRGEQLIASFGGQGVGPGRFGRIEALACDGNLLYVADSVNARVQVLLVAPPSMEETR